MRTGRFSACVMLFFGVLTVLAPHALFPVCAGTVATAAGGVMPMKCFWTARAASGLGIVILFAGVMLFFAKQPAFRAGVALALMPVSLLTALVPLHVIGVCPSEAMPCRMGTLPALCLLAFFTGLTAAVIVWRDFRAMRAASHADRAR